MSVRVEATASADSEIQQIWADVSLIVSQLAKAAGVDGRVAANMEVGDVLQCLDDVAKADMTPSKFAWVRGVFDNALSCLSTVGSIVSDGASYVSCDSGQ